MAATKTTAKKTAKTTAKKKTASKEAAATEMESTASQDKETKTVIRKKINKDLDPSMFVEVKNGFNGILVYISKKTGEEFRWDKFGDIQEMELSELRNAKNHSKAFFVNNWFLIDDEEVIDWLGVSQYYKNALTSGTFDELFSKEPDEIEEIFKELPDGQKRSLLYRSRELIDNGTIDSIKTINALEKCLGVELIDR